MRMEEDWAIALPRMRAFLLSQPDVLVQGGAFRFGGCTICLRERTGQVMGRWPLARTLLVLEGDEADVRRIHRRICLRFLSAGG